MPKCTQTAQLDKTLCTQEAERVGAHSTVAPAAVQSDLYATVVSTGLGSPLLLLGCVVIPLLPCLLLLRQRGHLNSPDVKRRLAFLFCSYRSVELSHVFCALSHAAGITSARVLTCH